MRGRRVLRRSRRSRPTSSRTRASADGRRAVGRVAEVERASTRAGITFVAIPPWICVTLSTSRKSSPSITTSRGSSSSTSRSPSNASLTAFTPEPRPRRVGRAALEDDARVEVAEAAELERVVGRLEADHERRLVDDRRRREDAPAAGCRPGRAPRAGRRAGPRSYASSVSAAQRASSIITASPPFMSVAPRPWTAPSSIRPGRFPCAGTVSVWPASSTSGLPARFAYSTDSPSS